MIKFTFKENVARWLLSKLKHNETEFIICGFNDAILYIVNNVLKVNLDEILIKCIKAKGMWKNN